MTRLCYSKACVYSQYNVRSDWLILGHDSLVMHTDQLWACKNKAKSYIINNLLTASEDFTGKSQTSTLSYRSVNTTMYRFENFPQTSVNK